MKAVLTGLLVGVLAAGGMAQTTTDGTVQFNVTPDDWSGYNPGTTVVLGTQTQADIDWNLPGTGIWFATDVVVTGNNYGLSGLNAKIKVYTQSGALVASATPDFQYWCDGVYKSPNKAEAQWSGSSTIISGGAAGGPGLNTQPSLGSPFPGELAQIGVAFLEFDKYRLSGKVYVGDDSWGVGMASRKANLLQAGVDGKYYVMYGRFQIPEGTPAGQYKLVATIENASVLKLDPVIVDGPYPAQGVTFAISGENLIGSEMPFTVIPEPATLLLLGVPALLIRRRRS